MAINIASVTSLFVLKLGSSLQSLLKSGVKAHAHALLHRLRIKISYVKEKYYYVAVLHNIILALAVHKALFLGGIP